MAKKTSAKYWEKRATQRLATTERASDVYVAQIKRVYRDARNKTIDDIKSLYENAYKDDKTFDKAALNRIAPRGDVARLRREMDELGLATTLPHNYRGRITRLELLNAQMWTEVKKAGLKHNALETHSHAQTINNHFNRSVYDVAQGMGATPAFNKLNTQTVNAIINSKLEGKNFSERIWKNTDILASTLQEKLATATATGESIEKTVREIRDRFAVNDYYAERLVRTETNFFANKSEIEAYKAMGFDEYEFLATLDGRTSAICQHHDKKIYKLKDAKQGYNAPPLHPNCRSTITPYFGKEYASTMRIARDPRTGKNSLVENQSYNDWAKETGIRHITPDNVPSIVPGAVKMKLGEQQYAEMGKLLENAPEAERGLFYGYEDQLSVIDATWKGHPSFIPKKGIRVDILSDSKDSKLATPFTTTFHEFGHNIDYAAGKGRLFSSSYKDGVFAKTLKKEALDTVRKLQQPKKSVDGFSKKISRQEAYDILSGRLTKIEGKDARFVSDIFSGATNNRSRGEFGHKTSYWKNPINLPAEAFTQMFSASIVNPQGLKIIKQYFPESYKIYKEMLNSMNNGKM